HPPHKLLNHLAFTAGRGHNCRLSNYLWHFWAPPAEIRTLVSGPRVGTIVRLRRITTKCPGGEWRLVRLHHVVLQFRAVLQFQVDWDLSPRSSTQSPPL